MFLWTFNQVYTIYNNIVVIKNKNGTEYKLRSPNPIMIQQDLWENFEIHNMDFKSEIYEASNSQQQKRKSPKISLGQTHTAEDEQTPEIIKTVVAPKKEIEIKTTTPEPKIEKTNEEENVIRPTKINAKLQNYPKTILHCLPSITKVFVDELYQDKTIKISYGEKFTLEAILIEESDMNLVFWTHLENISKQSIVYPKNRDKRWWRVQEVKKAPEGYFLNCMPSETHPSFVE